MLGKELLNGIIPKSYTSLKIIALAGSDCCAKLYASTRVSGLINAVIKYEKANVIFIVMKNISSNSPEATPEILNKKLLQSNYIILASQRIIKSRLMNEEKFQQGNMFYTSLIDGSLGYTKIYETPCDIFCKITYLGDPLFRFEQTANVFDRPTVMIFKNTKE